MAPSPEAVRQNGPFRSRFCAPRPSPFRPACLFRQESASEAFAFATLTRSLFMRRSRSLAAKKRNAARTKSNRRKQSPETVETTNRRLGSSSPSCLSRFPHIPISLRKRAGTCRTDNAMNRPRISIPYHHTFRTQALTARPNGRTDSHAKSQTETGKHRQRHTEQQRTR